MTRIVFTFGTLFDRDVTGALLGEVPENFEAALPGYAIYKAGFDQVPKSVQSSISTDHESFAFLFVKPDNAPSAQVAGRAYAISPEHEHILDRWEHFPEWYSKQRVSVRDESGAAREAFIYTVDVAGERQASIERVVNDRAAVLAAAARTREGALKP